MINIDVHFVLYLALHHFWLKLLQTALYLHFHVVVHSCKERNYKWWTLFVIILYFSLFIFSVLSIQYVALVSFAQALFFLRQKLKSISDILSESVIFLLSVIIFKHLPHVNVVQYVRSMQAICIITCLKHPRVYHLFSLMIFLMLYIDLIKTLLT